MPFETLDTTSRCLRRYGGEVLLSDTVGFIRRLPGRLLASFESTLSEIRDASLLLVVVDVSDDERALHLRTTIDLIEKIGAKDVPRFFVFNKIDRLETNGSRALQELAEWSDGHPWIALSSHDAIAVRGLEERILQSVERDDEELATFVPYSAADVLALVYGKCRVLESSAAPGGVRFRIRGTLPILRRIRDEARAARHDERTEHEEMHR